MRSLVTGSSQETPGAPSPPNHPALLVVLLTLALSTMAAGVLSPVMPGLVSSVSKGTPAEVARLVGLMITAFALMQLLAAPVQGALSDRFGRRPLLIACSFGLAAAYLLTASAPMVAVLIVGRAMAGSFSATATVAYAYLADVTAPARRAAAFGLLGAASAAGAAIGPAIGGALAGVDLRAPFYAAAALSAVGGVLGIAFLRESLAPDARPPFSLAAVNPLAGIGDLCRRRPGVLLWLLAGAPAALSMVAVSTVAVLFLTEAHGWGPGQVGLLLSASGAAAVLSQVLLVTPVQRWLGERGAILACLGVEIVAFVGIGASPGRLGVWIFVLLLSVGTIAQPMLQSAVTRTVGPAEQGQLQGVFRSLSSAAGLVGPGVFAGLLAAGLESPHGRLYAGAPFFIAALLMLLALILVATALSRPERELEASPSP